MVPGLSVVNTKLGVWLFDGVGIAVTLTRLGAARSIINSGIDKLDTFPTASVTVIVSPE